MTGRALENKIWSLETIDLRRYGKGKHKKVDDRPASRGPGMILRPDVLNEALQAASTSKNSNTLTICMSSKGTP